jgi:hypothetical protein
VGRHRRLRIREARVGILVEQSKPAQARTVEAGPGPGIGLRRPPSSALQAAATAPRVRCPMQAAPRPGPVHEAERIVPPGPDRPRSAITPEWHTIPACEFQAPLGPARARLGRAVTGVLTNRRGPGPGGAEGLAPIVAGPDPEELRDVWPIVLNRRGKGLKEAAVQRYSLVNCSGGRQQARLIYT